MSNLVKKAQNFSKRFGLLHNDDKVIVGVSGGPDSVCLLDILNKLKNKYNLKIIIAHINYNLRGEDSKKDKKFVEYLAKKYDLDVEILNVKKNSLRGSEEELRNIRYDFFRKIKNQKKYNTVAVAHNQDDQAETFLMRVLRGSGLSGLRGMRERNNDIVRPLLGIGRKEILDYLKKNKLEFRIDKSNRDLIFLRNKIRNNLIPLIEKEYNPSIKKTLALATRSIADDYEFIDLEAQKKQEKIILSNKKNKIIFSISKFKKNSVAIQRQILRRLISELRRDLLNVQALHIEEILKIIISKKNKRQIKVINNLKIERKGDKLQISV